MVPASTEKLEAERKSTTLRLLRSLAACGRVVYGVLHRALACLVLVLTASLCAFMVASGGRGLSSGCVANMPNNIREMHLDPEERAAYVHGVIICTFVSLTVITPTSFVLLALSASSHMCRVAEYAAVVWASEWSYAFSEVMECVDLPYGWIPNLAYSFFALNPVLFFYIVMQKIQALERSAFVNLNFRCLVGMNVAGGLLAFFLVVVVYRKVEGPSGSPWRLAGACLVWGTVLLMASATLMIVSSFRRVLVLNREAQSCPGALACEEVRRAAGFMRMQMLGVACGAASTILVFLAKCWTADLTWPPLPALPLGQRTPEFLIAAAHGVGTMDATFNALASLALSGALGGALRGGRAAVLAEMARLLVWMQATAAWRPHREIGWRWKVEELANRGITLNALVDFYCGLGSKYLESFDPSLHTTEDVVRGAIIPLSAGKRSSMAEILMEDAPVRPGKMVTHNWGNLFSDLVASIVADALEEKEYCRVAYLLTHDVDMLREWIDAAGVGLRTYWVCAFSVNQHSSICSDPRSRRDPVTGEEYAACRCSLPKVYNTTPPLSKDGHSTECELNKFEDVMLLLSASSQSFSQVVAVDRRFDIFSRAWCVAEIAAARSTGMPQSLLLPSRRSLELNAHRLANMKVAEMRASRPEDKAEILGRIADHDAFDRDLSRLLLGQLLPMWSTFDSSDQMRHAGRVARWQNVARTHPDIWQCATDEEGLTLRSEREACDESATTPFREAEDGAALSSKTGPSREWGGVGASVEISPSTAPPWESDGMGASPADSE